MCGWIASAFEKHCCEIGTLLQGNYKKIIIATKPSRGFKRRGVPFPQKLVMRYFSLAGSARPKNTPSELAVNNNLPISCQRTAQKVGHLIGDKYGG